MKYTRIYCDVDGKSHFEDVYVDVTPVDFAPPAPLFFSMFKHQVMEKAQYYDIIHK